MSDTTLRLLSLPAELRNIIWRLLLVKSSPLLIHFERTTLDTVTRLPRPHEIGVVATCNQIRAECLHIFYSLNRFYFEIRDSLEKIILSRCLQAIGPDNAASIGSVNLTWTGGRPRQKVKNAIEHGKCIREEALAFVARADALALCDELSSLGVAMGSMKISSDPDPVDPYSETWARALHSRLERLQKASCPEMGKSSLGHAFELLSLSEADSDWTLLQHEHR